MRFFRHPAIKILTIALMLYTIIGGFLLPVPRIPIIYETIRNQYFHVSMWFAMMIVLIISVVYAIRYLSSGNKHHDVLSVETANAGILLGVLGLLTGGIWANYTWGAFWSGDPKQNGAAIALLIYMAYFVLRGSIVDAQQKARVSAIYNIFAFATLIPLLYILPRMTDSLHPGSGGNPGFNIYDLDNTMRLVFYPSIIAWTMLVLWIASLRIRMTEIKERIDELQ